MALAMNESPNLLGRLSGESRFTATLTHMCGNVLDQHAAAIDREHFADELCSCSSGVANVTCEQGGQS